MARAIAERGHSPALLSELAAREGELEKLNDELLSAEGSRIDARLEEIEAYVRRRLQDIRAYGNVARAKAELAKHCREIRLTPEGESYRVSGEWDLIGRFTGAGGGNSTTRRVEFEVSLAA